jgi:2'-5' RNA ligase
MPRVRGMHGERLDNAIERVEAVVVRVLRGIAGRLARLVGGSPSPAALSEDDFQVIRRDWVEAVTVEIVPAVAEAFVESATVLAKEFADAGRPTELLSLESPAATDFLDAATNRLVAVSDTLWEVARRELADGVRAGEGIEELAGRLQEAGGFGEARARTIARTEVVAASNSASLAQALRLGDPSIAKEWLATMDAGGMVCDERTRADHCAAHEQVQPLGEPFEVGGTWLMYPGQPIGPADEVINCRCGIGYVVEDEPITAAIEATPEGPFHLPGKHDQSGHGHGDGSATPKVKVKDALNLAGRIRLKSGETFAGSGSISASEGRINVAWIDRGGERHLRFAAGQGAFEDDANRWRAENKGFTAELDPDTTAKLRGELERVAGDARRATAEIKRLNRDYDRFYAEHGEEPREREAGQAWRRGLPDEAKAELGDLEDRAGRLTDEPVAQGSIDGNWADLYFELQMDEVSESPDWQLIIGVRPKDAADDWELRDGVHDAWLSPAETRRLAKLLTDAAPGDAKPERDSMSTNAPPELEVVTAAAEVHTGAMVALRPSLEDAKRLAVEGGEPADQLHATLAYLGAAADIPEEAQERIIDAVFEVAEGMPALTVEGFAVSVFNPGDANDRDPCIVLGLSGDGLDDIHGHVAETLLNLQSEPAGFTLPEQHTPWQPHITLDYTDDVSMVEKLADRVGPVTFDALRVAFGGEVFDIPLGEAEPDGDEGEADDDFDWSAYFAAAIQAQFQSRMPPQLQAYWRGRLRLGTPGSFRRCVRELRGHFPEDTEGLCANLYHEATGRWPGRKKDHASEGDGVTLAVEPGTDAVEVVKEPEAGAAQDALPGEHFHTRVLEGVSTGMRQFAPGAITWRTPPFAYHWQWKSSAHNGLPETVQVGLVTRAMRDDPDVHFWGRLDLRSPEGLDYARRLVEGFARWSSVGGDESVKDRDIDVEYVLDVEVGDSVEDPEIDLMTFGKFRVAEISGVSVPALADATVEPTQELIDTLTAMGVIEPAQVAEPPAVEEIQEDEVAEFAAVRPHDTPTVEGTWDADVNVGRLPSPLPVTLAREEFAWIDDSQIEGEHVPKGAGSLPHHEVSEDGQVGAANVDGVRSALARLSQTDIPEADREAAHAHLAAHLSDAGGEPGDLAADITTVVVAAGHTITLPDAPPAAWFDEPADDELPPYGSVRVDAHGRLIGLLAPAQVNHRSFPGKRVKVPMGNVDYSGWQNKPLEVAEGHSINVGVITMDCGHASTSPGDWSYSNRREHYDNTCSIAARARAYEKPGIGVALAGGIVPWLDADGFGKLLASDLSGDWPPHPDKPGWRDFCAALAVPVGGFPNRARLRMAEGALVAAAVPVHFDDDMEIPMEMEDAPPTFAEGARVRVVDPRDPGVTEGEIAVVHDGPAYALMVLGRDEPVRWYVAEELEPADAMLPAEEAPVEVEELVASTAPDLRPVFERVARSVGLDAQTRMDSLHARVHASS